MSATAAPAAAAPATPRPLDDLDVAYLVWREAPAMLERQRAAVAAALGSDWRGTALQAENGAPPMTTEAARRLLAEHHPHARRIVLRMPGNLGYARAMDLALAELDGTYVALLNSDGRPEPDTLRALVSALEDDPRALWAAPAVHGPGERCEPPGPPYAEDRIAGTALVVRRTEFLALGGFDPLYWFYSEDYDASDRVRAAGRRLLRVPDARFHHGKGGRSRRGAFVRELLYAATDQTLVLHRAQTRREAWFRLARARPHSLADHARDRDAPGTTAIALATLAVPASALLAERRRRDPWDAAKLRTWLARHRPRVERLDL